VVRAEPEPAKPVVRRTALDQELARLHDGAFAFVPPVNLGEEGEAGLFIDPNPVIAKSTEEFDRALAEPGFLQGIKVKVADTMRAVLSAIGGRTELVAPSTGNGEQQLSSAQPARWIWRATPGQGSDMRFVLELHGQTPGTNRWIPVTPPMTYPRGEMRTSNAGQAPSISTPPDSQPQPSVTPQQQPIASPPARTDPQRAPIAPASRTESTTVRWLIAGLLAVLIILALLTPPIRRSIAAGLARRKPAAILTAVPTPVPAIRTRVLVVHGKDERAAAEKFCTSLGASRCEFVYGLSGFQVMSAQWQKNFTDEFGRADAVLVLLTGAALLQEGVNWQVDQVFSQQGRRSVPVYPVIRDEQAGKAASTLNRLANIEIFDSAKPEDLVEVAAVLNQMEPSAVRGVQCFLSYSRHDGVELADSIVEYLQKCGIECWRDTNELRAGEEWREDIQTAIQRATHVLFLVTPKSRESREVVKEVTLATAFNKVVVPLISDEAPPPEEFKDIQSILLFKGYAAGMERLVRDLTARQMAAGGGVA
jgi:hypothetical protein